MMVGQTAYQLEIFSSLTRTLEKIFSDVSDLKCHNFACMLVFTLLKNEENLKNSVTDFTKIISTFLPVILRILDSEESSNNSDFAHL